MPARRLHRFASVSLASALALVGAISGAAPAQAEPLARPEARTLSGAYLAARHAEAINDVQSAALYFQRALAFEPDNRALLGSTVLYLTAAGEVDAAADAAKRLVAIEPDEPTALVILAAHELSRGAPDAALDWLSQAAGGDEPGGFPVEMMRGWTRIASGDRKSGLETLAGIGGSPLVELFGRHHEAMAASLMGDDARAVAAMAPHLESLTSEMTVAYGGALERLGRRDEAASVYEAQLLRNGYAPLISASEARMTAGAPAPLWVGSGRDGAAEALFEIARLLGDDREELALVYGRLALHLSPEHVGARLLIGDVLDSMRRHSEAAAIYAGTPPDSPLFAMSQLSAASARAAQGETEAALDELTKLAADDEADATVFFAMGELYARLRRFGDCVESYDRGFERLERVGERRWSTYYRRAICHERGGDWEKAEADFVRALELNPDQPDVLNYFGYSLVEQGRRLDEARDMIERAVQQAPNRGYIVDSLGWVLYRLGDFEQAAVHLEEAVRLDPVDPTINDHFGDALWRIGRQMEARFQWSRALSFNPSDEERARIERKLEVGLDAVLREEREAEANDLVDETPPADDLTDG